MKSIKLKDDRILAYEEYGDPKGKPVFYFHGWPASRLSGEQITPIAKRLKLHIISPDRPGIGLSTFKPNRKLLDWPDDVLQLADYLGAKKFSVVGPSGGGPYVLACAYKIPERLVSTVVIAGLGPLKLEERNGLSLKQFLMLKAASFGTKMTLPTLLFYKISLDYFPGLYSKVALFLKVKLDKELIKQSDFKEYFEASSKEAFHQGIKGLFQELKIYASDWGFNLLDIKTKVLLWHGKKDNNVPFWLGEYVASHLKNCQANYIENAGHFLIALMGTKIFSEI